MKPVTGSVDNAEFLFCPARPKNQCRRQSSYAVLIKEIDMKNSIKGNSVNFNGCSSVLERTVLESETSNSCLVSLWRGACRKSQLCFFALAVLAQVVACNAEERGAKGGNTPEAFEACLAAGGKVSPDKGGTCTTESGTVFVKPQKDARSACKDLCGDGKCQEIVCMAVGCPCAESPKSCPSDCKG